MTTKGVYITLVAQLDKLARHNRQGSFRTKDRYYEAVKRFCAYLAVHYHLQKLENISGKHLVSYVLYLQEQGKSASTIKTDLSAIRFFHDKMSHPRYTLSDNEELDVPTDRAINGMQQFILRHRDAICDPTAPARRITASQQLMDGTYTPKRSAEAVRAQLQQIDSMLSEDMTVNLKYL